MESGGVAGGDEPVLLVQDVTLSSPRESLDGLHHCSGGSALTQWMDVRSESRTLTFVPTRRLYFFGNDVSGGKWAEFGVKPRKSVPDKLWQHARVSVGSRVSYVSVGATLE